MSPTAQKTILIVDDEVDLCEILQFDLEDSGYLVLTAHRVAEALAILRTHAIDLVVSDIRMPAGDGIQLLEALRQKHFADPPVIFISGFADLSMAEAFHKGVVGFIAKPLSLDTLLRAIEFQLKDPRERWMDARLPEPERHFQCSFASLAQAEAEAACLLGRGGIFLRIEGMLPRIDEVVKLSLHLQEEQVILEGWAICRWIRNANGLKQPRGAGLEWLKLTPTAARFVSSICSSERRLPYIPME